MPYAQVDENNRIVMWSEDLLDGMDVEFSNGDYVNKTCVDGVDDFIIQNGVAIYAPLSEKEIAQLKRKLADTDYISAKIAEGAATKEEYADMITQRQAWRDRINELA